MYNDYIINVFIYTNKQNGGLYQKVYFIQEKEYEFPTLFSNDNNLAETRPHGLTTSTRLLNAGVKKFYAHKAI